MNSKSGVVSLCYSSRPVKLTGAVGVRDWSDLTVTAAVVSSCVFQFICLFKCFEKTNSCEKKSQDDSMEDVSREEDPIEDDPIEDVSTEDDSREECLHPRMIIF